MTPKEKANELIEKFKDADYNDIGNLGAKVCALICVDEMKSFSFDIEFHKKEHAVKIAKYWIEVKKEINKL